MKRFEQISDEDLSKKWNILYSRWKRRKMAAEICSARAGLYKSWHCFRRMCSFSLFKNKGIL